MAGSEITATTDLYGKLKQTTMPTIHSRFIPWSVPSLSSPRTTCFFVADYCSDELNQHPVFPVPSSRASSRSHSALTSGPPKSQQYPPHYPPIPTDTPSAPRPLTTGPVHPSRRLPPHEQSLRISSQWQNPSFRQEHFASYSPPQLQAYHAAAPGGPEPAKHPCTFCSKTFSRPSSLKVSKNVP